MALADEQKNRLSVMFLQQHRPYFRNQAQPKMIGFAGVDDKDALRADNCSDAACRMTRTVQKGMASRWMA